MKHKYRNLTFIIILLFAAISFATSLYGLRHNNIRMEELRAAVYKADESGDEEEVARALADLRHHVLSHMNTDLSPDNSESSEKPIQLTYKYYRDSLEAWYEEIREVGADSKPLNDARKVCEVDDYVISERLSCLIKETQDIEGFPQPRPVRKIYYVYDFLSPKWSSDLAGLSLIVFAISLGVLVFRLLF